MEINEGVREQLVLKTERLLSDLQGGVRDYLAFLENCECVEDIMRDKQEFLIFLLNHIPLGDAHCYFCLENNFASSFDGACEQCEYGVEHERCLAPDSDYSAIKSELDSLKSLIDDRYYKGETYGGEKSIQQKFLDGGLSKGELVEYLVNKGWDGEMIGGLFKKPDVHSLADNLNIVLMELGFEVEQYTELETWAFKYEVYSGELSKSFILDFSFNPLEKIIENILEVAYETQG